MYKEGWCLDPLHTDILDDLLLLLLFWLCVLDTSCFMSWKLNLDESETPLSEDEVDMDPEDSTDTDLK